MLCVEILSPSDRFAVALAKMDRYFAVGIEACWIFDPGKKIAWSVDRDGEPFPQRDSLRTGEIEVLISDILGTEKA